MTELGMKILALASPQTTVRQIADALGCNRGTVFQCLRSNGAPSKQRKQKGRVSRLVPGILALADGLKTSEEIAQAVGCTAGYVQNVLHAHGAPSLPQGGRLGALNCGYVGGRRVGLDGYVMVSVGLDHPHAKTVRGRNYKMAYEHRLVMEWELGRYLLPGEIVDHIDGLCLHNDPSNLRLFASNREHLQATISGHRPNWSPEGWAAMTVAPALRKGLPRIDTYAQRKRRGEIRLLQILRAASRLGIDSPFLLGTLHHLTKAGIDYSSQTTIEHALAGLCRRCA